LRAAKDGSPATMKLYEAIDVWRRISDHELVRYRCFRNLQTSKYSVQSSDLYKFPLDQNRANFVERQFLELFAASSPDERALGFDTLPEAIEAHERAFGSCGESSL